ncbi:MAG: YihY/virulence factor BrkB family protein [Sphingobacteriales bacterium]|nr:MAG: YihY/virulence factor BrkB family protein [Sphingobacteriales bacterium]
MNQPDKLSYWGILKQTASDFIDDNVTKLSASLAYYTLFSIGPLILIVISTAGLFFEQNRISQSLFEQIRQLMGESAAQQILSIAQNMRIQDQSSFYIGVGLVTLFIGATSVFADMQDSINTIWSIKAKPKQSWLKYITSRLLSFSLIIGLGFVLMVSLLINTLMDLMFDRLLGFLGESQAILAAVINYGITFVIITLLFTIIYKVLPDAKVRWRDTITGAAVAGILFMIGKFAIGYYLGNSSISNQYGAAASVIFLLLWVNYSSLILYFGAEFTKVWALNRGTGIIPAEAAVFIRKSEETESTFHPKDKAANPELRGIAIPIIRVDDSAPDAEVAEFEAATLESQQEESSKE